MKAIARKAAISVPPTCLRVETGKKGGALLPFKAFPPLHQRPAGGPRCSLPMILSEEPTPWFCWFRSTESFEIGKAMWTAPSAPLSSFSYPSYSINTNPQRDLFEKARTFSRFLQVNSANHKDDEHPGAEKPVSARILSCPRLPQKPLLVNERQAEGRTQSGPPRRAHRLMEIRIQ